MCSAVSELLVSVALIIESLVALLFLPYFTTIRGLTVSAHFVVRRDGACEQFVSCDQRAWHAGQSAWRGRENCNDFSIGIELEGLEGDHFEKAQYDALGRLTEGRLDHGG